MSLLDSEETQLWRKNRFNFIVDHYGKDYFKDKTLLEVGCGYGDLGNMFAELGAVVTCVDGRPEHVAIGQSKYPNLEFKTMDLDKDFSLGQYDIVLHCGLLYHLENPVKHLDTIKNSVKTDFILDVKVVESSKKEVSMEVQDKIPEGSLTGKSLVLSEGFLDDYLHNNFSKSTKITDVRLNSGYHVYNWISLEINEMNGRCRMWICAK